MRNPLRIAKRKLRKEDPYITVGNQVRREREQAEMTQWQLADQIAQLLETRKLLEGLLPQHDALKEHPISVMDLEAVKQVAQDILQLCRIVRSVVRTTEAGWINATIAELLNIEQQIGAQVEAARDRVGLTQEQLSIYIGNILQVVDTAGPPGRAGISKVERGERRLDLLEAWAAAIALQTSIDKLLPPQLADMLPNQPDPMRGWHPCSAWHNCRQFRHTNKPGVVTIAVDDGVNIPVKVLAGRV